MVVVLFYVKRRAEAAGEEYKTTLARMLSIVSAMPGFISVKEHVAADGDTVVIVKFENEAALEAWRNHPEHRAAQSRGRELFYDAYHVEICSVLRQYDFTRPPEGDRRAG